jgi:hypothetical protein
LHVSVPCSWLLFSTSYIYIIVYLVAYVYIIPKYFDGFLKVYLYTN